MVNGSGGGSSNNMPPGLTVKMHSQNVMDLAKELTYHPQLAELLLQYAGDDLAGKLGEIAAYVDIALHGDYYQEDIDELCGLLAKKLYAKRSPIIIN